MKKAGIVLTMLALGVFALAGCGKKEQSAMQGEPSGTETVDAAAYTCSMHPDVISAGPGKCNVCGMNLEEKSAADLRGVKYAYVCPMNDQTGLPAAPGKCDKCGMDLVKTGLATNFVCPMHPEQVGSTAGKCAVCGMEMKADTTFLENKS
jgi:hypothetical protein